MLGNERGTAFLLGLTLVMVMTLLGVALFEMSTIEASLARSDVFEIQAFYCAEAEAARIYNLYAPWSEAQNPFGDKDDGTLGRQTFGPTNMVLQQRAPDGTVANVTYVVEGEAIPDKASSVVTVTATCTLPNGRTRTVQRNGTKQFFPSLSLVSGIPDPAPPDPSFDFFLGGNGGPVALGGPSVGGADRITGDIYVSGNAFLRGDATVTGYDSADALASITVYPGKSVVSTSSAFDPSVAGATAQAAPSPFLAMPVTSADGTGMVEQIQAAVTGPDKQPLMKGTYQGFPVYNLTKIFKELGATSEGNVERNLARPSGCTFGVASSDVNCQVWQDLVILGPRQICNPSCPSGVQGPRDLPSYFFMGLPRTPSVAPQGTSFDSIFAAAVNASPELQQLKFTPSYTSLGSRLDVLVGANPDVDRFVDLTVGTDPATGESIVRAKPPIFYVDGYWRVGGSTGTFAYNGRATVVASKSMILSDDMVYLGGLSNVKIELPSARDCSDGSNATACGLGDMLGLVAKEDVWIGDSTGAVHQVSAIMMAGRDVNYFYYSSSGGCCKGPSNPVTVDGAIVATRQAALVRDWADPSPGREGASCNLAQSPCRPVAFFPADPSCATGCWKFLTMDPATGVLSVDGSKPSFGDGCVTVSPSPPTPAACPPGTRRVTHFQFNLNYDARLKTTPSLLPPGLPAAPDGQVYTALVPRAWRDCGSNKECK